MEASSVFLAVKGIWILFLIFVAVACYVATKRDLKKIAELKQSMANKAK